MNDAMSRAVQSTGMIMLITGAGGALGKLLSDSELD